MKYALSLFAALALLFSACGGSGSSPSELEPQVMAIHDEVMPKMGEINQQTQRLSAELAKLQASEDPDPARVNQLEATISDLKDADQKMRTWMRNYAKDYVKEKEHMTEEEQLALLQVEMDRVQDVKDAINGSLAQAKSL
jgi:ribosomal protein L16 Arg81 hydroxylase